MNGVFLGGSKNLARAKIAWPVSVWVFFFVALVAVSSTAQDRIQVDLELILLADGSGSIDDSEFALQRRGYARALRDPRVFAAIKSGYLGRIALSYVEWSGPDLQVPIVPWKTIQAHGDLVEFAEILDEHPRELYGGGTALGNAILFGVKSIEESRYDGRRRVIDLSGDGPDRNGLPAVVGRDAAIARGITVNGLAILDFNPWLADFFRSNLIGGPGAFVIPADDFNAFETAIRIKLIREIASNE